MSKFPAVVCVFLLLVGLNALPRGRATIEHSHVTKVAQLDGASGCAQESESPKTITLSTHGFPMRVVAFGPVNCEGNALWVIPNGLIVNSLVALVGAVCVRYIVRNRERK